MVATPSPKPPTLAQRSSAALQSLAEYLHLDDQKALAAAVAELAATRVRADATLAADLQHRYDEIRTKPAQASGNAQVTKKVSAGTQSPKPKVAASRTPGEHVDIVSPLDPRSLLPLYGAQLPTHLGEYSNKALAEMARVLAPSAGEKAPALKAGQQALITYILRYVGSGTASANA